MASHDEKLNTEAISLYSYYYYDYYYDSYYYYSSSSAGSDLLWLLLFICCLPIYICAKVCGKKKHDEGYHVDDNYVAANNATVTTAYNPTASTQPFP